MDRVARRYNVLRHNRNILVRMKGGIIVLWEELGVNSGTAIIILITLYYIIKWAVKNGINESTLGESSLKSKIYKYKSEDDNK